MEEYKDDELTFEFVLNHLHEKVKHVCDDVEAVFASQLMSMINLGMPVLNSHVLKNLDVKLDWHHDREERIERSIAAYEKICEWYDNHFESGEAEKWIKLFDKHHHEYKDKITDVKKIDLILWQIRD